MQGLEWEAYWHYMELCQAYNANIIAFEDKSAWNEDYDLLQAMDKLAN